MLVLRDLVGLHRTIQLQLLRCYWLGHRLGLAWYWMVCLGNEQRSFCHFWDCIQVLDFRLLLTMMATPFLLRDSLVVDPTRDLRDPTVVDIMVIWVKFTHSSPNNSCLLIPITLILTTSIVITIASCTHMAAESLKLSFSFCHIMSSMRAGPPLQS